MISVLTAFTPLSSSLPGSMRKQTMLMTVGTHQLNWGAADQTGEVSGLIDILVNEPAKLLPRCALAR